MAAIRTVSPAQFGLPDAGRDIEKAIGSQNIYGYVPGVDWSWGHNLYKEPE